MIRRLGQTPADHDIAAPSNSVQRVYKPEHDPHLPLLHPIMPGTFDYTFDTPAFKGKVSIPTGLFIGGKWVDGSNKTTIEYVEI